jgi:hypothetical protein
VDLLAKYGRKILVRYALTNILVYLAMVIDLPPWGWKAIDKIRRGFFWQGHKGGHCQSGMGKSMHTFEIGWSQNF